MTRDDARLGSYRNAQDRVASTRRKLRVLISDNPAQLGRLDQIDAVIDARLDQLEAAFRDARTHPFSAEAEAQLTNAGLVLTSRLSALVAELDAKERNLLDQRTVVLRAQSESVRQTIAVGFSASIAIVFVAFMFSRREVSRRQRSEQALAERERHLAATLTSIGDGVIATDATGVITKMNPVAEELTGWPLADAVGRRFAEVFRIISEDTRAPEPDPAAEHSVPVQLGERVRLQGVHAVALLRLVERERLDGLALVVELGEHELAVAGDQRARRVAIVARRERKSGAVREQVVDEHRGLLADRPRRCARSASSRRPRARTRSGTADVAACTCRPRPSRPDRRARCA